MNLWVVTPTYNERQNIGAHVSAIRRQLPAATILVVDDNSPDGTGQLADELARADGQLQVRHRTAKEGLGRAYADGLAYAIAQGADIVVHLDADQSHPVEIIPAMLQALEQADMVLASRYVRGGSMKIDPWRQFISWAGNAYIQLLLGRRVHDWSTGFKAWRAPVLRRVLDAAPASRGYAWLMETSWLAVKQGARIAEVPLVFRPRTEGKSKFSAAIAVEDLKLAWTLHWRTLV